MKSWFSSLDYRHKRPKTAYTAEDLMYLWNSDSEIYNYYDRITRQAGDHVVIVKHSNIVSLLAQQFTETSLEPITDFGPFYFVTTSILGIEGHEALTNFRRGYNNKAEVVNPDYWKENTTKNLLLSSINVGNHAVLFVYDIQNKRGMLIDPALSLTPFNNSREKRFVRMWERLSIPVTIKRFPIYHDHYTCVDMSAKLAELIAKDPSITTLDNITTSWAKRKLKAEGFEFSPFSGLLTTKGRRQIRSEHMQLLLMHLCKNHWERYAYQRYQALSDENTLSFSHFRERLPGIHQNDNDPRCYYLEGEERKYLEVDVPLFEMQQYFKAADSRNEESLRIARRTMENHFAQIAREGNSEAYQRYMKESKQFKAVYKKAKVSQVARSNQADNNVKLTYLFKRLKHYVNKERTRLSHKMQQQQTPAQPLNAKYEAFNALYQNIKSSIDTGHIDDVETFVADFKTQAKCHRSRGIKHYLKFDFLRKPTSYKSFQVFEKEYQEISTHLNA